MGKIATFYEEKGCITIAVFENDNLVYLNHNLETQNVTIHDFLNLDYKFWDGNKIDLARDEYISYMRASDDYFAWINDFEMNIDKGVLSKAAAKFIFGDIDFKKLENIFGDSIFEDITHNTKRETYKIWFYALEDGELMKSLDADEDDVEFLRNQLKYK